MSIRSATVVVPVVVLTALVAWNMPGPAPAAGPDQHGMAPPEQVEHTTDAAGRHEPTGGGHGAPNPLILGPDLAVVTAVIFVLLLLVLGKFAWGPILEALDRRERGIAENIAAAAAQREEAKHLLNQYESKLSGTSDQIREMLEEARRDAEATKAGIIAEAKTASQAEQQRALREVRNATDAALRQLAETSANLAVDLAGRIVKHELSASDHAGLIRDAVAQLPSKN